MNPSKRVGPLRAFALGLILHLLFFHALLPSQLLESISVFINQFGWYAHPKRNYHGRHTHFKSHPGTTDSAILKCKTKTTKKAASLASLSSCTTYQTAWFVSMLSLLPKRPLLSLRKMPRKYRSKGPVFMTCHR